MRIRALNEPEVSNSTSGESSNDEGRQQTTSKECSEEQCFDKYRRALVAIQEFKVDEARTMLEELSEELQELESDENETMAQLRFSVLKNLGNLTDEIQHYIDALDIDPSDICLWIKAGDRSTKLGNFSIARHCYEQALNINPDNWVAIDRLIELYYVLHLPFELYDICMRALSLNHRHKKAQVFLEEAKKLQPSLDHSNDSNNGELSLTQMDIVLPLREVKIKRRSIIQNELHKVKKARLGITLDTARTQSLASFGNYIIKIYERFSKQGITRNSVIDITLNNTLSFCQQFSNGSITSQSNNQNSNEQPTTSSQDVYMAIEGDGTSISDKSNDKSNNRNEQNTSTDDNDQTKSNSRGRPITTFPKGSSLSFAAMLFPMDLGDKRRSSRNRSNQDDTFSFKMKFDELNELLPECLRIGAIEQVLQQRREEQEKNAGETEKQAQEESVLVETNQEPMREDLIIKSIIESISETIQPNGNIKSDIKLCDIFYLYLSKLSANKQNTLPEAFAKIYKIYRRLCPLPNSVFVEVNSNGLSIDELWFTLTANEITYQQQDCLFLLRLMEQLQMHLDETQHKEFLVRLFLVLGLNHDYRYLEVALQNIGEDMRVYASNRKIITRAYIKTLIDRTTEKLQQENEDAHNALELINRLAPKSENEMSDREIISLCSAVKSTGLWQRGLDILNQRNDLNSDVIIETINICLKNGAKMDAILSSKLCKDAISGSRPTTWTCLYRGWVGHLSESEKEDTPDEVVERMDKFFEIGHQTLGKKCACTADKGEFLMLYVKHLLEQSNNYEEREILGVINCLIGYPSKKPASVAGHKSQRVPIIWEYADLLYQYLSPETLPTYMSLLRKAGITSELEPVFKEIAAAVPNELNPSNEVHIIENLIDKGQSSLDELTILKSEVTKDIYYFLADYYFKNKDFGRAKQYYHYDLVINPERFDSWAASGLIRANGIDKALSEGTITMEDFLEGPFHDLADSAIRCFEHATKLKPNEPKATLWIEFGNLTYNLTALASRLYTYSDLEAVIEGKELEDTSKLEARHKKLYLLAKNCFKSANTFCQSEEVWLHYYMLGKIYEKVDTFRALEYYSKADAQLLHEGASYPRKISYHNPPDLAYEAMEVHYRIHSSALKYLLTTQELTQDHMNQLKRFLMNAQRSPFVEMETVQNPKQVINQYIERDVGLLVNDLVQAVCNEAEFDELIFMCLHGMKRCLIRCDKNFKALYRLSFYYHKIRDSKMAQDILLVRELKTDRRIKNLLARKPGVPEFQAAPPDLRGVDTLFKDRRMGNLFFNIWRIPVEEVDRPGSFEHWMYKCTWLLIKTSVSLNDFNMLSNIAFQLSRQPETSKKYLQDQPRILLALFAVKSIIKIITSAIEQSEDDEERRLRYIKEGMDIAERFIKANVFADKMRDLFNRLQANFSLRID